MTAQLRYWVDGDILTGSNHNRKGSYALQAANIAALNNDKTNFTLQQNGDSRIATYNWVGDAFVDTSKIATTTSGTILMDIVGTAMDGKTILLLHGHDELNASKFKETLWQSGTSGGGAATATITVANGTCQWELDTGAGGGADTGSTVMLGSGTEGINYSGGDWHILIGSFTATGATITGDGTADLNVHLGTGNLLSYNEGSSIIGSEVSIYVWGVSGTADVYLNGELDTANVSLGAGPWYLRLSASVAKSAGTGNRGRARMVTKHVRSFSSQNLATVKSTVQVAIDPSALPVLGSVGFAGFVVSGNNPLTAGSTFYEVSMDSGTNWTLVEPNGQIFRTSFPGSSIVTRTSVSGVPIVAGSDYCTNPAILQGWGVFHD